MNTKEAKTPDSSLDCLGDFCPVPVLKTKAAINGLVPGESIRVLVDHSCALQNIRDTIPADRYALSWEEVANGVWEITITRRAKAKHKESPV